MDHSVPFGSGGSRQEVVRATPGSTRVLQGERYSGDDGYTLNMHADNVMRLVRATGTNELPACLLGGDDVEGVRNADQSTVRSGANTPVSEGTCVQHPDVGHVLAKIESVARGACDVEVVKALAGNTTGLRVYLDKAENVALHSLSVIAAAVGAYPNLAEEEGTGTVRVDTHGLTPGYEKPTTEVYPEGFCYLDWTHDYTLRLVMAELGKWPTLGALVGQRLDWFDLKAIASSSLYSTAGGKKLHVTVLGGGRVSALTYLVNWVRTYGHVAGGMSWPSGSLGEYLAGLDSVKPLAGSGVVTRGAVIGGTDGENGAPTAVREAVLDSLVEQCGLGRVDRSRLWEAVQLAGNGVTVVDGRPLMSGNKVLAMLGDAVLKAALIEDATHLRVGDIQAAVSDLLSNGCLADAAKVWTVGPMLQGSLGGSRPSDYVLATAVEAIAAACYYGGGMDAVRRFVSRLAVFTGRTVRYPWLLQFADLDTSK